MSTALAFPVDVRTFVNGKPALPPCPASEVNFNPYEDGVPTVVFAPSTGTTPPSDTPPPGPFYTLANPTPFPPTSEDRVFAATLLLDGGEVARVVCKMASGGTEDYERLHNEVQIYRMLSHLQGKCIPEVIGFYEGHLPVRGGRTVACLVIENAGQPVKGFGPWSIDIRKQIVEGFIAIHKAGVRHGQWENMPYVWNPTTRRVSIIDFGYADRTHKCKANVEIKFGTFQPSMYDLRCKELWTVCEEEGVWIPSRSHEVQ